MVPATGGSVNVTVTAARDCTWTASSESSWMQLNSTSGQGNATLAVSVARNELPSSRSGAVAVNDQRVTISQEPQPCIYELRGPAERIGASGGRSSIGVETATGCTWTANSSAAWLRVLTPSGSGAGTVEVDVEPNTGGLREATVAIGDRRVTITQSDPTQGPPPPNCGVTFNPPAISAAAAGGTHTLSIGIGPTCDWTATSSALWLTMTSPASGRGSGALTLSVARNTGAARSAAITIGTQTASVNQAAAPACTVTIDPTTLGFAPAGGEGRIRVTTQAGCEWATTGGAPWIQVATGSGNGSGEARYTVTANTATTARAATLTIGGQNHNVTQQAAAPTCTYALDPPSRGFSAAGGNETVTVNTAAGCQWSASNVPPWVTVSGGQGAGPGQLSYTVQANSAVSPRSGGITIGGQVHAISQEAATASCSYSLQPAAQNFGAGGGEGRFTVVTQVGCTWSASSGAPWATVTTVGGPGQGDVVYAVQANSGQTARATGITVNGQVHNVTQDAAAQTCTYAVQPASANFAAAGGDGRFDVITQAGCAWTASSGAPWAIVGTASGSGPGQVAYNVQANTVSSTRSTTITVNGQSHTITQDAVAPACTYNLNPGSQNFPAAGGGGRFTVMTQAGCSWSASSGASWAAVTTPSGSGQGDVTYSVDANTVATPRQTNITVNGQSHSVNQEAAAAPPPCSYSIDPGSRNFDEAGGQGTVRVTTGPSCTWTASSPVDWIRLSSSGGTGTNDLQYTVTPNPGDDREATITVAGQPHRVSQREDDDD